MLNILKYKYDVRIDPGANILNAGSLPDAVPGCAEMVITSKKFTDYKSCEDSLSRLMGTLSAVESRLSQKNFVIASKVNPRISDPDATQEQIDEWDSLMVVQVFIADADALKNDDLKYSIMGHIKVDNTEVDLIKNTSDNPAQ